MTDPSQAAPRPWTPTEKPGDTVYKHPVVYIGDHQLPDSDSDESFDESPSIARKAVPAGKAVLESDLRNRAGPIRFKSSQALREEAAAAAAPEVASYQPYRVSRSVEPADIKPPQSLRPRSSHQALSPKADERLPENNPFRLSKTLHPVEIAAPKSPVPSLPSPRLVSKIEPPQTSVPSRLTDLDRSESRAGLFQIAKPKDQAHPDTAKSDQTSRSISPEQTPVFKSPRLSQVEPFKSATQIPAFRSPRLSQAIPSRSDDDLPSVVGRFTRDVKILLINPTTDKALTDHCLEHLADSLPSDVTVCGFTASRPAPTAIESQTDAIVSTTACTRAILPIAHRFDAFLVVTFVYHPLIAALREQLMQPVIGTLEASLYASRMCGSKLGLVTIGTRTALWNEASTKIAYGLGSFSVGAETVQLDGLSLESLPEEEVENRIAVAARRLQMRGADCVCLEPTGIKSVNKAAQDAIGHHDRMALVVDGLSIGVQFLVGLVRENLGTVKGTLYNISSGHKSLK